MYFFEKKYINPVYSQSEISHTLIRFTLIRFFLKKHKYSPPKNQTSIGVKYLSKFYGVPGPMGPGAYLFFLR